MTDTKLNIEEGTINFWIEKQKLEFADNKATRLVQANSPDGSVFIVKDDDNKLKFFHVYIGKGRTDVECDVSGLDPSERHMITVTWSVKNKETIMYVDNEKVASSEINYKNNKQKQAKMKETKITKQLHDVHMRPFGIRPAHLQRALKNPDTVQRLEFGDLAIDLYMQTSHLSTPPTTLIIIERMINHGQTVIDAVYKTYLQRLGAEKTTKPLGVLKLLAEKFGISITVLNREGKFFAKETIPIPEGFNPNEIIRANELCPSITSFYCRVKDKSLFEVAFAFGIKTEDYKAWLAKQR